MPWLALAAVALLSSTAAATAGPCTSDIAATQIVADAHVRATALQSPPQAETTAARTHHQPTPESIAQAEASTSEGQANLRALAALAQARQADQSGDGPACKAALATARDILSPK